MADSALFVGFGTPVRGREREAQKVFNEAIEYYTGLQQQGEIESFEPVLLAAHGGDLGGFFLLRGEVEKLGRVRVSDDFQRLVTRADLIAEGLGVVPAVIGEGLAKQMALYNGQVEELT